MILMSRRSFWTLKLLPVTSHAGTRCELEKINVFHRRPPRSKPAAVCRRARSRQARFEPLRGGLLPCLTAPALGR